MRLIQLVAGNIMRSRHGLLWWRFVDGCQRFYSIRRL